MQPANPYRYIKTPARLLGCLLLLEYVIFIFSGTSFSFLTNDTFFSLPADPAFWVFFGSGISQFIISHHWLGLLLDISILLLLLSFAYNPSKRWIAFALCVLLFIFYITLMGYLTHRNYQFGFFLVLIPFIFKQIFRIRGNPLFPFIFLFLRGFTKISPQCIGRSCTFQPYA